MCVILGKGGGVVGKSFISASSSVWFCPETEKFLGEQTDYVPTAIEIRNESSVGRQVFAPSLHVVSVATVGWIRGWFICVPCFVEILLRHNRPLCRTQIKSYSTETFTSQTWSICTKWIWTKALGFFSGGEKGGLGGKGQTSFCLAVHISHIRSFWQKGKQRKAQ